MKTLAIIGAGDLGKQFAHYAIEDNHYGKVVFIDDYAAEGHRYNIPIIGKTKDIELLYQEERFDELIIAIGYKFLKEKEDFFQRFFNVIPFGKIVHSSSWVDPSSEILAGSVVFPNCSIDLDVIIHENTVLNNGCTISHNSIIKRHCFLSPRVAIAGFTILEEKCILGINSTIIDNVTIVKQTQIGAGSVVTKNINKAGLYVGNPHRFIR
jgi:sugar O-acyltransferase (sialic acid O-acetyltransferase NeuD family)